jgi:hypothetical protein
MSLGASPMASMPASAQASLPDSGRNSPGLHHHHLHHHNHGLPPLFAFGPLSSAHESHHGSHAHLDSRSHSREGLGSRRSSSGGGGGEASGVDAFLNLDAGLDGLGDAFSSIRLNPDLHGDLHGDLDLHRDQPEPNTVEMRVRVERRMLEYVLQGERSPWAKRKKKKGLDTFLHFP